MIAGKLLSSPLESQGPHGSVAARVIATLDRQDREVWELVAYNRTARSRIIATGVGERSLVLRGSPSGLVP